MLNAAYRLFPLVLTIVLVGCASQGRENESPAPTQASVQQVSAENLELVEGQVVYVPT
jgi:uncharacterized lipoprotein YbaY